jgi:hypothetical protein
MWLTENYTKFSHPQIARMMVVYHEARHTEIRSNFWPHAKCPTPFLDSTGKTQKSIFTGAELSGKPACDKVAVGAYGSSLIMLNNISKFCTNCTSKIKADAELYSLNQMQRIVNRQALDSLSNDR